MNDQTGVHTLLKDAIYRAQQNLISLQDPDGYWLGELIVDSTLCSDYITFMHWSGEIDFELQQKCVDHILSRQLPDGGWNIYPEGPSEVNASVKAYLSLKLTGFSQNDALLSLARAKIHELGGIERTNTYARLYLALLGQIPWEAVPTIPVEFLLLPRWLPVNLYAVSSWTRAMVVPLAIINHYKPARALPEDKGIRELYLDPARVPRQKASGLKQFFILIDRCLKFIEGHGVLPLRKKALAVAAITLVALARSGIGASHPSSRSAVRWLLSQEVRIAGDWVVNNPDPEPSGWCFEFNNPFCPDVDDTAMVLLALYTAGYRNDSGLYDRVVRWLLSFQNRDGGWAAFDKDVQNPLLENVPFADHNAILDPSCCDVTARVLEILGHLGFRQSHHAIRRAVHFLKEKQETDGAWYGRWGVNYIYGTSQVLRGLLTIGVDMNEPWVQGGRDWLEKHQNEDGGWGETVASYEDPKLRGRGVSTPSQTAWAVLGLCAFEQAHRKSIEKGIRYLINTQNPDGSWSETLITGTGFHRVFYLKYDMYRNNWPLFALARYAGELSVSRPQTAMASRNVNVVLHSPEPDPEAALSSLFSGLGSLPVFELVKDFLTKLNHG